MNEGQARGPAPTTGRAKVGADPGVRPGPSPAVSADLPHRKAPELGTAAGKSPGPYAPRSPDLSALAGVIEHLVQRQVKAAVGQYKPTRPGPPDTGLGPAPGDMASDEVARLLLGRMQSLAQQERFRLGLLR